MTVGEWRVGILPFQTRNRKVSGSFIRSYARSISLSLWLTVSWQSTPYYYGNDLVYLMAWLPLLLAGAPYWSVDALRGGRRRVRV